MTTEELTQLKDIIHLSLQGENARNAADHEMLNVKLSSIDKHLEHINSKVQKHEKIQNERSLVIKDYDVFKETRQDTCPQDDRIDILERDTYNMKAMKKYNAKLFTVSTIALGLFITLMELLLKF